MKPNSKAYNRYVSRRKALRKRRIAREIYPNGDKCPYYDNLHQYSKNKIHCSCSAKTRNKGKHRYKNENYFRHLNYKTSELRRIIAMDQDIYEIINREEKKENEKESAAAASSLDLA